MIEIKSGTLEERIIKELQKSYPITVSELSEKLSLSRKILLMKLKKLQSKAILILEPLPDKIYIRLIRGDFHFIGKKVQKRFIKRKLPKRKVEEENNEIMYI